MGEWGEAEWDEIGDGGRVEGSVCTKMEEVSSQLIEGCRKNCGVLRMVSSPGSVQCWGGRGAGTRASIVGFNSKSVSCRNQGLGSGLRL